MIIDKIKLLDATTVIFLFLLFGLIWSLILFLAKKAGEK
jgi:hypothetical protein